MKDTVYQRQRGREVQEARQVAATHSGAKMKMSTVCQPKQGPGAIEAHPTANAGSD